MREERGTGMDPLLNVALLVRECGKIEGRKKLQKIVHILQESGAPFRERFGMLHYGPYSSELKRELDLLVNEKNSLITETEIQKEYKTYVYSPGEKLGELLKNVGKTAEPSWAQTAQNLNDLSAQTLEAMSTILFLQKRGFHDNHLEDRFNKIKPQLASRYDEALKLATQHTEPTA